MTKYTEKFKLSVVDRYLTGSMCFKRLAREVGVAPPQIRRWVTWYRLHGVDGLSSKSGHYSAEFKLSVLQRMWDNGLSQTQAAAAFNVSNTKSIGEWERRYLSGGIEALAPASQRTNELMIVPKVKPDPVPAEDQRTRDELLDELAYLRAENAYLKKLKALVESKQSAMAKKRK